MANFKSALTLPDPLDPGAKRLELDEFVQDTTMTNLLLLGLEQMQNKPLNELQSEDWFTYYNLSSIHGEPVELWQGVRNTLGIGGSADQGFYCAHGSTVFPTWHRLYILQFEQALARIMHSIADQFSDSRRKVDHQAAAKRFRWPYWDIVLPRFSMVDENVNTMFGFPEILASDTVWVTRPGASGKLVSIRNPLNGYRFPSEEQYEETGRTRIGWQDLMSSTNPIPPGGDERTIRTPDSRGRPNLDLLNASIRSQVAELSTAMWQLLSRNARFRNQDINSTRPWEWFASHFRESGGIWPDFVSLESWHDQGHVLVGSGQGYSGHMIKPQVAGFDPCFWLHHCNIDRLFAIYQALYPDMFVADAQDPGQVNAKTGLSPFNKTLSAAFDSDSVRSWTSLGYAVPGNQELDDNGKLELERYLRANYYWASQSSQLPPSIPPTNTLGYPKDLSNIVALHGEAATGAAVRMSFKAIENPAAGKPQQLLFKALSISDGKREITTAGKVDTSIKDTRNDTLLNPPGTFHDSAKTRIRTWNVLLHVRKYAFNGSFSIHVFIGRINDAKAESFMTRANEVGFSGIFASTPEGDCVNCRTNRDMIYEDVIPLSTVLPQYLSSNTNPVGPPQELRILQSLEPDHVVPFLKDHMGWRIVDGASQLRSTEEMEASGLEMVVADRFFDVPTDDMPLGLYHESTLHPEVTEGKVGGFRPR